MYLRKPVLGAWFIAGFVVLALGSCATGDGADNPTAVSLVRVGPDTKPEDIPLPLRCRLLGECSDTHEQVQSSSR